MSAEILRRAASLMRDEHSREDVDDVEVAEFHLAVADWLDAEAVECDALAADGYESPGPRHPALAVARAYLGDVQ